MYNLSLTMNCNQQSKLQAKAVYEHLGEYQGKHATLQNCELMICNRSGIHIGFCALQSLHNL
jgi:hypothetical protein